MVESGVECLGDEEREASTVSLTAVFRFSVLSSDVSPALYMRQGNKSWVRLLRRRNGGLRNPDDAVADIMFFKCVWRNVVRAFLRSFIPSESTSISPSEVSLSSWLFSTPFPFVPPCE